MYAKTNRKYYYVTDRLYINIDTGEVIEGNHKTLKKEYNVIEVHKTIEYNYLTKKTLETWILQHKPVQQKLF